MTLIDWLGTYSKNLLLTSYRANETQVYVNRTVLLCVMLVSLSHLWYAIENVLDCSVWIWSQSIPEDNTE